MNTTDLRKDITGLRAIAVIAVTLFHLDSVLLTEINFFKGGFLGVDIFFVISGFLMTKIIVSNLEQNKFHLYAFYKRRAKRICPALLVVVLFFSGVMICIGDLHNILTTLRDGLRSLGFISNIWFANRVDYFEPSSSERLFLHTWSLSVEWQFYLIYPILLMLLAKKLSFKVIGKILLILTILLLILGCVCAVYKPFIAYFYLPTRAYELLIGALAYFYPINAFSIFRNKFKDNLNFSRIVELSGLTCIIISIFIIDSDDKWPNVWSILPLLGTYLCIANNTNNKTLLANVIFQKIGLWSYSIYLVHWPVIVICNIYNVPLNVIFIIITIILLSLALHYGVERHRKYGWGTLLIYFVIAGSIQWLIKTDVSIFRDFKNMPAIEFPQGKIGDAANRGEIVHVGNLERPVDFIFFTDSFGRHYMDSLERSNVHAVSVNGDGCVSTRDYFSFRPNMDEDWHKRCRKKFLSFLKVVKEYPDLPIVWTHNWFFYTNLQFKSTHDGSVVDKTFSQLLAPMISQMASDFARDDRRLYVLGNVGVADTKEASRCIQCSMLYLAGNTLSKGLYKLINCQPRVPNDNKELNLKVKQIVNNLPQNWGKADSLKPVVFVDLDPAICNEKGCSVMTDDKHYPMFFDGSHFTVFGADAVLPYILQQIKELPEEAKIPLRTR